MPPIGKPPKTIVIGGGIGGVGRHNALMVSAMLPSLLAASKSVETPVEEPVTQKRDGYTIRKVDPSKFGGPMPAPGRAFKDDPESLQRAVQRLKDLVALNPGMRINPKRQAKKAKKK
jgi:hypothetical protein